MLKCGVAVLGVLLTFPIAAQAQDDGSDVMPEACELSSSNGFVRIVVCSGASEEKDFISAGRAACAKDVPCGAWIWTEASSAPTIAPANHDGLTQEQVTAAKGVWVAERDSFIAIDQN